MPFNLDHLNQKFRLLTFFAVLVTPLGVVSHCLGAENISHSNVFPNTTRNFHTSTSLIASNSNDYPLLPTTINLVKQYEGFRSYAYIDTSGLPVIGYGLSKINGKTVRIGQYVTQSQADTALAQELYHIQRIVQSKVRVQLTPNQLGALTSLVYNAGTRVITNSTLSRKLNSGDFTGAAREFPRWNKANQGGRLVALPGLTKRRLAEQKMFLTP